MGLCDLIPGISGGTLALLLGFYPQLIESINNIRIVKLLQFKIKEFAEAFPVKFLAPLLSGALVSIMLFSKGIHWILNQGLYRTYFYGAFFGLILASTFFCLRKIKKWGSHQIVALIIGLILAFLGTGSISKQTGIEIKGFWLSFSGALAISAMLLPGISGSYILTILGVYELAIQALADLCKGLQEFSLNLPAFSILSYIALGIFVGALIFSRFLSWLLKHYEQTAIAFLSGTMLGAIRAVWPFWIYEQKGEKLVPVSFYIPEWGSFLFWQVVLIAICAFCGALLLDWIAGRHRKKEKGDENRTLCHPETKLS